MRGARPEEGLQRRPAPQYSFANLTALAALWGTISDVIDALLRAYGESRKFHLELDVEHVFYQSLNNVEMQ